MVRNILLKIWRALRGPWQWYALWLTQAKFMIGVSGVLLDEQGRLLLLRHRFWPEGSWGLPSGLVKKGEILEETLVREVFEETGLHVEDVQVLRLVSGYRLRLEVHFYGRLTGGEMRLDTREVLEAGLFFLDELPAGLLQGHRESLALFQKQREESRGVLH